MLENTPTPPSSVGPPEARQVNALLRLVEDLGFEVQTGETGQWIVSATDEAGDQRVVGIDDAQQVVTAARSLAESLMVDRIRRRVLVH